MNSKTTEIKFVTGQDLHQIADIKRRRNRSNAFEIQKHISTYNSVLRLSTYDMTEINECDENYKSVLTKFELKKRKQMKTIHVQDPQPSITGNNT
jgi:hypothetical protein